MDQYVTPTAMVAYDTDRRHGRRLALSRLSQVNPSNPNESDEKEANATVDFP